MNGIVTEQTRSFVRFVGICLEYLATMTVWVGMLFLVRLLLPRTSATDTFVEWALVIFYGALHLLFFVHILVFWWRQEFPVRPKTEIRP